MTLIDADVHADVPDVQALFPYLSAHWREHVENTLFKGAPESTYPRNAPTTGKPVTSVEQLRSELLDPNRVEVAIVNCSYAIDSLRNPDAAIAFASAVNDWLADQWLAKEPRLRASMVVPSQLPFHAAREIDRAAELHPGFVQVYLPARSHHPYGNRLYEPLWDAIARHDLVAGLHFGGVPGNPPTPSGWPSFYMEEYVGMAQTFASQLTSIVSEGVFDRNPKQRLICLESGFTWVPAHMWRFDKEWKNLRRLVPWVKDAPSAYIREHVRFSMQPLDLPPTTQQLLDVFAQLGSDEMVLYASDHPHRHAHELPDLPAPLARRIRSENARKFYRL